MLDEKGIKYEIYHHPPVYTVDEAVKTSPQFAEYGLKSLFLKDNKGRYYLVSIPGGARLDMKSFKKHFGVGNIRFADEAELTAVTGLKRGHVTPFGILNAGKNELVLVFDAALRGKKVAVHPFTNDATVILGFEDLLSFLGEKKPEIEISIM